MAIVSRTIEEIRRWARSPRPKRKPKTEEEIRKAAQSDPDTWLPTEKELERFKPWRERAKSKAKTLSEDGRKFNDEN